MKRVLMSVMGVALAALLAVGCSNKPSEEDLFTKAKKAQETKDFTQAIDIYKSVVEFYPAGDRADEAQFMVGFLYANDVKDTVKAREAYQTFLDKFSATSDSGMILSAKWEIANLGRDVEDIDEVMKFIEETEN